MILRIRKDWVLNSSVNTPLKGLQSQLLFIAKVNSTDDQLLDFTIDTGELVRPIRLRKINLHCRNNDHCLTGFCLVLLFTKDH